MALEARSGIMPERGYDCPEHGFTGDDAGCPDCRTGGFRMMGEAPRPKLTRDDMERALTKRDKDHAEAIEKYKERWTTACVENEKLTRRVAELENEAEGGNVAPDHPTDGITPRERAKSKGRRLDRYAFTESSKNVRLWTGECIMTFGRREEAEKMADKLDVAFYDLRSEQDAKDGEEYTERELERCMRLRREHPERFEGRDG